MSIHNMKFVLVNGTAPRKPCTCSGCSRPLNSGYLHDFSNSKRYCGIECYPPWMLVNGFAGAIALVNPFELAIAWPMLTVGVASALFDGAWRDILADA